MTQESMLDYKGLQIKHIETADEEIVALLENIILGTEGGLHYSVKDIRERMGYYGKGLSFIALYKRNNLIGAIGLCQRKTVNCGTEFNATFLRYLAVRRAFQISRVSARRRERMARLYESLSTNRRMGTLSRLLKSKPGLVYFSFSNISIEEQKKFSEFPAYTSGFDFA
jgi:hypothetical protein